MTDSYDGLLYCDALPIATSVDLNLVDVMNSAGTVQHYTGTSTVSFQIEEPSTCLFFHAHPERVKLQGIRLLSGKHVLRPKGVHNVDAGTAAVHGLPLKWGKGNASVSLSEKLPDLALHDLRVIELPHPLSYCVVDIMFDFHSSISDDGTGVFIAATRPAGTIASGVNLPAATCLVATHFEVDHAHKAFPCVDFTFVRQTIKFVLTVPAGAYCRSNGGGGGSGSSSTPAAAATSKKEVLPPSVRPIPFYIAGFIASTIPMAKHTKVATLPAIAEDAPYDAIDEESVEFCVVTTYDSQFMSDLALKSLVDAAVELRNFFHCGYDLPHLYCLAVPKLAQLGGMENDGFIFLRESLGVTNQTQPGQGRRSVEAATKEVVRFVVHEVAHHWIGNRVGFSFAWKEGITLVLERYFGNILLGIPPNQGAKGGASTSDSADVPQQQQQQQQLQKQDGAGGATPAASGAGTGAAPAAASSSSTSLVQVGAGQELSGLTYHKAEAAMEATVRKMGWDAFRSGVQKMIHSGEEYVSDKDIVTFFRKSKK